MLQSVEPLESARCPGPEPDGVLIGKLLPNGSGRCFAGVRKYYYGFRYRTPAMRSMRFVSEECRTGPDRHSA